MIFGLFLLSILSVSAYDFEVEGVYYEILSTAELTCEVTSGAEKYVGDIKIPTVVNYKGRELSVVSIGKTAFNFCSDLTSVVIPSSVTTIGVSAFYWCTSLTSVVIPSSVTTIGDYAFFGCTSLTSVVIPSSVTSIGESAFFGCTGLTSVIIPSLVTSISPKTFCGCTGLTSVVIPSSVTSIGESVFYGCTGLTSVVIPSSVKSIRYRTFFGCTGLTSVVIPSSVTSIGRSTFSGCTSLTSVSIPGSVSTIDKLAFEQCSNLKDVTFESSPSELRLFSDGNDTDDIFKDCNSLTKISIGRNFYDNSRLSQIMPSITDITDLVILDGLNLNCFFYYNDLKKNLTTLELGKGITNFGVFRLSSSKHGRVSFSDYSKLETIICKDPIPTPDCPTFSTSQYVDNIKVYVPQGSLEAYQNAEGWKNFWNIIEMGESGIDSVIGDSECKEIGRYNLQGRKVSADYKGVVIVKYSDGTAKKIISDGSAR